MIRFALLLWKTFWTTKGNGPAIMEQILFVTARSLGTVIAGGIFVGAIIVLQFNLILSKFDAQSFLGGLNTSSVVREIGPLLISFLLAGKIGAFTAAELGTMRVTEQIDAIECLGTHSIQYLIIPRFFGIVISSIILLQFGLMVSIGGSITVASLVAGINPLQFITSIPRFTGIGTLMGSIFKSFVYGTIVAGVSCYKGYTATGGAKGVGRAVTEAAVATNFCIIIAQFLSSSFIEGCQALYAIVVLGGRT